MNARSKGKKQLEASDPGKILELCTLLTDCNSVMLQLKINKYLQEQTGAAVVYLVPVLATSEEAVIQVVGQRVLDKPLRFSFTNKMLHTAVKRKTSYSYNITELDKQFQSLIVAQVDINLSKLLTVPVYGANEEIVLLACLVDVGKRDNAEVFATKFVEETFRFCLTILINTLLYEEEIRIKKQCQALLLVARRLFSHLGDLEDLLKEIMSEAKRITHAERCSLFLVDPERGDLVAKVFEGIETKNQVKPPEVRIAQGQGIAGHVMTTGNLLNIRQAYEHPLFYKGLDEKTGFKTRNILCFPIRDEEGIIGVAQLCNKADGFHFDACDEEVASAFSIYCGISIMHSLVYKKIMDAQARSKISNELMMYHMKVSNNDVAKVLNCKHHHRHQFFENIHFDSRTLAPKETPCFALKMYENLNLIRKFQIRREIMVRFILYVQKGYRDMAYHNWMHAFSVAHFAYSAINTFHLLEQNYLTELECLAYITSCLCHDLDHRGTNNSFEISESSVLASLYSSEGSVMERHHLSQAMCILNTEGCNILLNLKPSEYDECLQLIRDMILATDLANHFKELPKYKKMAEVTFDKKNSSHRTNLSNMLMTCADLGDQIKDWTCIKTVAMAISKEFFRQGDKEKDRGVKPIAMMDRERAFIPEMQILFLRNIALPVFVLIAKIFPVATKCEDVINNHIKRWTASVEVFNLLPLANGLEMLASNDLDNLIEEVLNTGRLPYELPQWILAKKV